MNRTTYHSLLLGVAAGCLLQAPSLAQPDAPREPVGPPKPNVLFIAVDDLNTDLGVYGHPVVKTPHLDKLAARGVRFDRAFAQSPLCNPSRHSFLSGLRPETVGIFDNATPIRVKHPDVVTMPQWFRTQGYFSARAGKIFHDELYKISVQVDDPRAWDATYSPRGTPRHLRDVTPPATDAKRFFFKPVMAQGDDADQPDGQAAREIVRLMEQRAAQSNPNPFFLALGLRKPHNPYVAPKKYFDLYSLDQCAPNLGPPDDKNDIPPAAFPIEPAQLTDAQAREFIRGYYACNSFMDAQVGTVLNALDRLKLRDNTVVVFFSDHGLHLGEHGWWSKLTLFERSARVPLIIAGPGIGRGVSPRTVELVDLYPTLLELCKMAPPPAPEGMALGGKSLAPLLRAPNGAWDKPALTVTRHRGKMGRSIRTERFRYTEWNRGEEGTELYDHQSDPNEWRNLAQDPAHAATAAQLKAMLPAAPLEVANQQGPKPKEVE